MAHLEFKESSVYDIQHPGIRMVSSSQVMQKSHLLIFFHTGEPVGGIERRS